MTSVRREMYYAFLVNSFPLVDAVGYMQNNRFKCQICHVDYNGVGAF